MKDPRYERLAELVLDHSLALEPGRVLRIAHATQKFIVSVQVRVRADGLAKARIEPPNGF